MSDNELVPLETTDNPDSTETTDSESFAVDLAKIVIATFAITAAAFAGLAAAGAISGAIEAGYSRFQERRALKKQAKSAPVLETETPADNPPSE